LPFAPQLQLEMEAAIREQERLARLERVKAQRAAFQKAYETSRAANANGSVAAATAEPMDES